MGLGPVRRLTGDAAEAILLAMAVLAPWAYGSVDAWAELALEVGVAGLALLGLFAGRAGRRPCGPSLALGGLALLAMLQATPLPVAAVRVLAPGVQSLREGLAPAGPRGVVGDDGPPVAAPASTLGLEPESAAHAAAALAAAWVLLRATLNLRGGRAAYRRFGLAMAVNAALLTVFSVAQALMWDGRIYGVRRTAIGRGWYSGGPFVCHNHLAAYLNLGLGFALGRLLAGSRRDGPGRGRRLVPAYAAGLIAVGVLATHSRGGFLAMLASAVVTLVALRGGARRGLPALAAMVGVFLVAVGGGTISARLGTILDAGTSGLNGRAEVWGVAARTWWAHPLLGTGLGSFATATTPGFDRDRGVFFSDAESEPLQMLVEGGVVGLALVSWGLMGAARLSLRALAAAPSGRDRAAIVGGLAGGVAVLAQSLGDFGPRIPGVAVAALVSAGHLCRLGLEAGEGDGAPRVERRRPGPVGAMALALAMLVCRHGVDRARAEAAVLGAGLPRPGAERPGLVPDSLDLDGLERARSGLERALRYRPDWPEGHLRLGITLMGLYEATAREWLAEALDDDEEAVALADPLRLREALRAGPAGASAAGRALAHEPVRRYLAPAARSFLSARRASPATAAAHAGLGGLDYLLAPGEPSAAHAGRALRLSGNDAPLAARAGRIAAQAGDLDLAARCWRRAFAAGLDEAGWAEAADDLARLLPTPLILDRVLDGSGRDTLRFARRELDEDEDLRGRFLRAALERLPGDPGPEADRRWHEGQALALLGDAGRARPKMRAALEAEPLRGERREEYVGWLIAWGDPEEAHRQALRGAALDPRGRAARSTLERAVSALALKTHARRPPTAD